ncbi:MAG: DUF4307 domain-containing protein [Mycobacteriales bacterium]
MTTPRRPPGRYDERRPVPRGVLIVGAAVLGLLLVGLAYTGYSRFARNDQPTWTTIGYTVVDDTAVDVRFEVRKALTATVECLVQARDRDGVQVASDLVRVGPSDRGTVTTVHRLATPRRAVIGEITGCRAVASNDPHS